MRVLNECLRVIGSLRIAAVLLVLLAVAMAAATLYEAEHGTPQAQATFYHAWWFEGLLGLLGANVLVSMLLRWPFHRRQIGFVITHVSILVILIGAWVTQRWGVDGYVRVLEGETVNAFELRDHDVVSVRRRDGGQSAAVSLDSSVFRGFTPVDDPPAAPATCGPLTVQVKRFLPDSRSVKQITDDSPTPNAAVEVALTMSGERQTRWVFAESPPPDRRQTITLRVVPTADELARLVAPQTTTKPATKGTLHITSGAETYDVPVDACIDQPAAVGDGGLRVRVLRYLPNARVGADRQLHSISDEPLNPAVEVELTTPEGTERRVAFARFPEFASMHRATTLRDVKVVFDAPIDEPPASMIEVLAGPQGALLVRFDTGDGHVVSRELQPGVAIDTPWEGVRLEVVRRFDHARREEVVEPVDPPGAQGTPAVLVSLHAGSEALSMWLQHGEVRSLTVGADVYSLAYQPRSVPLAFNLTLQDFRIGTYPGTQRPRSFESHVECADPSRGGQTSHTISMNRPLSFGGYRFFQQSFDQGADGQRDATVLSVSRDPGQPIVFAGYAGLLAGMLWVLVLRMRDRRRAAGESS